MNIHVAPITQVIDDEPCFIGVPTDHEGRPIMNDRAAIPTSCAVAITLRPTTNVVTGAQSVSTYVHDHHGRSMISSAFEGVTILDPHLVLNLN